MYLRGFAKVTRDDTALKRTEEALRESAERFGSLFHGVRVGVVLAGRHSECRKCPQDRRRKGLREKKWLRYYLAAMKSAKCE